MRVVTQKRHTQELFVYGSTTQDSDIAEIVQTVVAQNANTAH